MTRTLQTILHEVALANDKVDHALEIIENVLQDNGHWCEDLSGNIEDIKTDLENLQYKMVTVWNEEDD
tara:strand:+ start:793 stop:996 length:204 start_codon:yes stop_codon:yes gene_type:complete